jgi:PhzF family phenazine biosynthesis protein
MLAAMGQPVVVVDAFTERAFAGNPAAVCVLDAPADEHWMQLVAREMNLSETAFLAPEGATFRLRWFTPTMEVELCGHATLASAHVLWQTGRVPATEPIVFATRSGLLTACRDRDLILLDFPSGSPQPCSPLPGLAEALGATVLYLGRTAFDYLVELASETVVRELRPDLGRLAQLAARGIIVTARSDDPTYDFVSRFFAPAAGIAEDPVTGSAHCCLGPYWGERLGKTTLVGRQVSARGGVVRVALAGGRARLGGHAVTVLRGELDEGAGQG